MPSEERDRQFERALQKQLRGESWDAACPDAEMLAAYHERTLSLEELTHWKEHISGCVRCQETLALLEGTNAMAVDEWEKKDLALPVAMVAKTVPPGIRSQAKPMERARAAEAEGPAVPEEAKSKSVARNSWRWVAPLGALAAGLILLVGLRENRMPKATSVPAVEVAENREAPPPQTPTAKPEEVQELTRRDEPALSRTESKKNLDTVKEARPRMAAPHSDLHQPPDEGAGYAAAGNEVDKAAQNDDEFGKKNDISPSLYRTAPAPAPNRAAVSSEVANSPAPSAPAAGAKNVGAVPGQGSVGGMAGGIRKQSEIPADKAKAAGATDKAAMTTAEVTSESLTVRAQNFSALVQIAAKNPKMILAPDKKHAWRIGAAGSIESTSDAGVNWRLEKSGVNGELTAGSSPSARVCWIVGKAGMVLRTTDGGKRWKTIVSPLQEDLGGVHAVDAEHAAIWNVENRKSFETADGGVTWTATANK